MIPCPTKGREPDALLDLLLIVGFALSHAIFVLGPPLLLQAAGPSLELRAGLGMGETFDLFAPVVLALFYYGLFIRVTAWATRGALLASVPFLLALVVMVEGHGMHLAANAISHFVSQADGSPAFATAYFYDEVLSHYLWHGGSLALAVILMGQSWRGGMLSRPGSLGTRAMSAAALGFAAIVYGLTVAIMAIEGQTVLLNLPAAVLISVVYGALRWRCGQVSDALVLRFFAVGYAVAATALVAWGVYFGGFPQFSELGFIS